MFVIVYERGCVLICCWLQYMLSQQGILQVLDALYHERQLNLATVLLRIYFSTHHPHITQSLSKHLLKLFLWGRIKQVWRCLTILYSQLWNKMFTCISNRLPAVDRFSDLRKGSTLEIPRLPRRNKPHAFSLFALHFAQNTFGMWNDLVTLPLYEFLDFYASKVKKVHFSGDYPLLE